MLWKEQTISEARIQFVGFQEVLAKSFYGYYLVHSIDQSKHNGTIYTDKLNTFVGKFTMLFKNM